MMKYVSFLRTAVRKVFGLNFKIGGTEKMVMHYVAVAGRAVTATWLGVVLFFSIVQQPVKRIIVNPDPPTYEERSQQSQIDQTSVKVAMNTQQILELNTHIVKVEDKVNALAIEAEQTKSLSADNNYLLKGLVMVILVTAFKDIHGYLTKNRRYSDQGKFREPTTCPLAAQKPNEEGKHHIK